MTEYQYLVALGLVAAGGILLGIAITAGILVEHRWFWVVILRLPDDLYRRLRISARANDWDIRAEVLSRLYHSLEVRP